MTSDDRDGWWEAPGGEFWTCPECHVPSPIDDWEERRPPCDDCGEHDGRECPKCGEVFEHVWGASAIGEATAAAGGQP